MQTPIKLSHYPLSISEKMRRFRHPRRKRHYSRQEMVSFYKILSEPIAKPGYDENVYRQKQEFIESSIMDNWADSDAYIKNMLRRGFVDSKSRHPLSIRRRNGVPRWFHLGEVQFRVDQAHADADLVIAAPRHDDLPTEDKFVSSRGELKRVLIAGSNYKYSLDLANAALWLVEQVSNPYKPGTKKYALSNPGSLFDDNARNYLVARMAAEDNYFNSMNYLAMFGSGVLKMFDRLYNNQTHTDPKSDFNSVYYAIIKGLRTTNWTKCYSQEMSYYTLEGIRHGLERVELAYPDARKTLSKIAYTYDLSIPADIFSHYNHHILGKSFDQQEYERQRVVIIDSPRPELSAQNSGRLPYSGSEVAVIFVVDKKYWIRIDACPIEIQFPKRIGRGDPVTMLNWRELDSEKVLIELQAAIDKNNLPFEVVEEESLMAGKMGMNFINLRLIFSKGSFVKFLGNTPNPTLTLELIVEKLRASVGEIVSGGFEDMEFEKSQEQKTKRLREKKMFESILSQILKRSKSDGLT